MITLICTGLPLKCTELKIEDRISMIGKLSSRVSEKENNNKKKGQKSKTVVCTEPTAICTELLEIKKKKKYNKTHIVEGESHYGRFQKKRRCKGQACCV